MCKSDIATHVMLSLIENPSPSSCTDESFLRACIASMYIHCWDDAQGACSARGRAQNSTPRVLANHPAQISISAQLPGRTQDRHPRLQVAVLKTFPFAVAESSLIHDPRRIYFSGCDQYTNGEPRAIGKSGRPVYMMNSLLQLASFVLLP